MLFNSINFAVFLPIVFILHWYYAKANNSKQNLILILSSYFFYASWDWRFLFLLAFSTALDYYTGSKIAEATMPATKKRWLILSLLINLGLLFAFKYFNFFADSLELLFAQFGIQLSHTTLEVILPVGISFYTFHGISYVFDIYHQRIQPEKDPVKYALFVSFFPLLVAGPIERATNLLPQLQKPRQFNYGQAIDGLKKILWGLFKKIVIADQCAEIADPIFDNHLEYSSGSLLLGAFLFTVQIYGDFSGYSDIAIGTAKLFGIDLVRNFSFPYFATNIGEFWRRWHISLSSWFRDYLYIPLGGSKGSSWLKFRNIFLVFLLSGLWHGANWTFVAWGLLNAIYVYAYISLKDVPLFQDPKNNQIKVLSNILKGLFTFTQVMFGWILFRSRSIAEAYSYLTRMCNSVPETVEVHTPWVILVLIVLFFIMEWLGQGPEPPLRRLTERWPKPVRWFFYYILVLIVLYFSGTEHTFIYFQF